MVFGTSDWSCKCIGFYTGHLVWSKSGEIVEEAVDVVSASGYGCNSSGQETRNARKLREVGPEKLLPGVTLPPLSTEFGSEGAARFGGPVSQLAEAAKVAFIVELLTRIQQMIRRYPSNTFRD